MHALTAWLRDHWVTGAGFMAASLLAVWPALHAASPLALSLIFLHSPGYMLHQVEEHAGDRFRDFVNRQMFGGREALGIGTVLVINLPVVWGLNLAALYAALLWGDGFALAAPYAMLVNSVSHIGATLRFRRYNPGLATSLLVFLPLGIATIVAIGPVGPGFHVAGLALALLLHLAIIAVVMRRVARIRG